MERKKKLMQTEDGAVFPVKEEKAEEPADPVAKRIKKKKRNKKIWMGVCAFLFVGVLVLQVMSRGTQMTSSSTVKEEVITAKAENGEISQTLKSAGVLASAKDISVAVPGNISVTKYLVENGKSVEEGTPIAVVEKNSVMAAIADLQEMMDELDEEMEEVKEDSISSSIKASVDGTVAAVYAASGKDVVDVMYEKGALVLISLDDLLAIKIDNPGNLTVGDSVKVKDSDGNSHNGQVASVGKEKIVVTVSLDDFSYKEKVTVMDSDKKELGSGKLYIYSQQKITGYSGEISSVKVEKGDSVSEGTTLLTLTNTDYTAAYQTLLSKRCVLENQYNTLIEVGNSGYVYAAEAGTISGIEESLVTASVDASSTAAKSTGFMLTSSASAAQNTTADNSTSAETSTTAVQEETTTETDSTSTSTESTSVPAETVSRSVNAIWLGSNGNVLTENLPANVTVRLYAGEQMISEQILSAENLWKYSWSGLDKYNADGTEIVYSIKEKEATKGYTVASQVADSVTMLIYTEQEEKNDGTDSSVQKPTSGNTQSKNQMPSSGNTQSKNQMPSSGNSKGASNGSSVQTSGNGTANGNAGTQSQQEERTYEFEETVICSLSPNDTVEVDITIDELDINLVKTGQECQVVLDAFPGQNFEGEVSAIDKSGTNSGGNTKYTVTISMAKEENMLLGMNASVGIVMTTTKDVLLIPEAALVEQEEGVFVYTKYNERKDELSGLVEVTTGISDGENVQILEGIASGEEYYYRYADTISYTFIK